ncbi:CTC-interacting domain 11 [Hibiscus trionum]|uniref:CTC-interacting domain 11 n=1 Tax=Hibiscus trionum TaxID=183268 RepID=A0A9W7MAB5_HIBTR|nr:CTC-interacting domain 11 [Hibiscus trionum]
MAVADNAGARIGPAGRNVENAEKANFEEEKPAAAVNSNGNDLKIGFDEENQQEMLNELSSVENGGNGGILKNGMSDLAEMLSKLNPMAEEFVPPSLANLQNLKDNGSAENGKKRSKKHGQAKRNLKKKTRIAQRADAIRNTVYVTDISPQVTEEVLAGLFLSCGPIVDCRVCSVPCSALRFAFVEFHNKEDAKAALNLSGTVLGFYPLKVLPSKTAIAPVNPTFLPKSEDEREKCSRTIYCTNIHKKVTQADAKLFFESYCGQVLRLKLLKDSHHPTHSAFVEFRTAASAIAALNCSGAVLESLPIRVAPSKTPVRRRAPRPATH